MAESDPIIADISAAVGKQLIRYTGATFRCIFCDYQSGDQLECHIHLLHIHKFIIPNIQQIPLVPEYLSELHKSGTHTTPIHLSGAQSQELATIPADDPADFDLRMRLHKKRLEMVMSHHESERTSKHIGLVCPFCGDKYDGTWHEFLQWLFETHQFNPGRPSNLVFIPELIDILSSRLKNNICIYCGSVFPNQRTLHSHLRKKRHLRISGDPSFDRFYMVNYLELDRSKALDGSDDEEFSEPMESLEDAAQEINENEINETICLVCEQKFNSPDETIEHMTKSHGLSIPQIYKRLGCDFYKCVRFVNYCRYMKNCSRCFVCGADITEDYASHLLTHQECIPNDFSKFVDDDVYLIPVIEGDPILTDLEADSDQ